MPHITVEKKEVCSIKVSELEKGMRIINVGIVKAVDEYSNATVVKIVSGDIQNALDQVNYSPYKYVWVECVDEKPVKIDRYF